MEIGIVGKPNVGKSTFFTAATLAPAEIQNYPFTTIKANRGVGHVRVPCPERDFDIRCTPRTGNCEDGTRYVPIEIIDVAGLVPDAHKGKGLGNKFLDDLRQASALIHVIDASGRTDFEGNATEGHDPAKDVEFLDLEVSHWIKNIFLKGWDKRSRQVHMSGEKVEKAIAERLTGLGINDLTVLEALRGAELDDNILKWTEEDHLTLAREIRKVGKPMIIAANKVDLAPKENIEALKAFEKEGYLVVPTCAEYELALRRASKAGLIDYLPGDDKFTIKESAQLNVAQRKALDRITDWMRGNGSTGIQRCLEEGIFRLLDLITVFPVEDENKLTDKDGRVLPDAYLVPKGTTAKEVAFKVHTDIGSGFIRAINVRTKRVIGADHEMENLDVIKIVSSK
jgi:ribosome-binding ATPase YchF (GTP1/OBG family)